jgi:type I restriction enzyme S subunit
LLLLVSNRIDAQRKLVELLKKHKRGVIEQIFGRRLDMGKDAEKWDIVELRDLFSKVARRNRDGKVKNVITNSAEFGLIPQRDFFDKSIAVDGNTNGYYVIRAGDFVYNPRKSATAPFGPFNRYTGTEDGIISPLYTCLVPKGKANPEYLAWYFRSTAWHRYVYDNGSQGARHDRVNMTDDLLFGIPVLLPPIAVQERIANGLNAIDARWSSANIVLAHLEKMKRGLLQQLFA